MISRSPWRVDHVPAEARLPAPGRRNGGRDGHCRSFDAGATSTVFSSGCGVVLLRRVEDALADGDHIYAVIKASSLNNDGSAKVGFMAPSPDRQGEVITTAHAQAGISARAIGFVEDAWHQHATGRSDRVRGPVARIPRNHDGERVLRAGCPQDEHRSHGSRRRRKRAHQGRAGRARRSDPSVVHYERRTPRSSWKIALSTFRRR